MLHDKLLHPRHWQIPAVLTLAAVGLLAYVLHVTAAAEPTIPATAALGSWYQNGQGERYLLQLAQGTPWPVGERVEGIVTSDSNCRPDAQGLSHCHNAVDLANGAQIVVINTHQMSRHRCLAPGDRLALRAIQPNWLIGTLSGQ